MRKRYISLYELLCILAITSITGSLATKLFMEFIRHSQALEQRQQNQRDLTNIVRSLRIWASDSNEKIKEIDGFWYSGKNEIYLIENKIIFKVKNTKLENKIPMGYEISLSSDSYFDNKIIILNASRNGLKYSIKLKLGGES